MWQKDQGKIYMVRKIQFLLGIFFIITSKLAAQNGTIEGIATDKKTGETIIGAIVSIPSLNKGTTTDFDGKFKINGLLPGKYSLKASYLAYKPIEMTDIEVIADKTTPISIIMAENETQLTEVVVTGMRRSNTEIAMLQAQKTALTVTSGVSSQQITRTQDRDASEVIKRIPGISIIDDKFVIARGLSQRYNNVWINNSAVPSSEADSRSFSFDIIPSSQIENITIVKSPSPELPADFSGGFIKVATQNMPSENSFQVNYGMNYNTKTTFGDFKYNPGSNTDWLGFDNGYRNTKNIIPVRLDNNNSSLVDAATKEGFNNNWNINTKTAIPDQRFSMVLNRRFDTETRKQWGLIAALNYSNTFRTYLDVENSRFGVYDTKDDQPTYKYRYNDNIYTNDVRLGGMFNLTFIPNPNHKFEFRNIMNQLGKDRYTERYGYQYISGYYKQEKNEYLYSGRMAYSGQFSGNHTFLNKDKLDWTAGFSYSNKNQPDRRIIEREENGNVDDKYYGKMETDQNEIFRDFIKLNEYIYSFTTNYNHNFDFASLNPALKTGTYAQYRDRDYSTRSFYYRWKYDAFPTDFPYRDVISRVLVPENYGSDKLYIYEDTDNRDSYSGNDLMLAGYLAFNIPVDPFNIYAGVRYEYNTMSVTNYTSIKEFTKRTNNYDQSNLFPSVNASYTINKENLLRLAYGTSINRQEFREVSSSSYYDFELFSMIKGNPNLKPAHIQNIDFRYEYYPSASELISIALFYKYFKNPIEWTYIDAGGSYTYTFENAESARNFGLEVDIKKNLGFAGMKDFNLTFNGSLIDSKVLFGENSREHDRAMQGQSPYLINTGLFYQNEKCRLSAGLLYNIIGKRIVGIGQKDGSEEGSIDNDVPDLYEMPRNALDFTISKKFGKLVELSAAVKDILAQDFVFKQFPKFHDKNGELVTRNQTSRKFAAGQNVSVSVKLNF